MKSPRKIEIIEKIKAGKGRKEREGYRRGLEGTEKSE